MSPMGCRCSPCMHERSICILKIQDTDVLDDSCANIAWELIYSVFYPPTVADQIVFFPWLIIDMVLVYATIKFGPKDWSHSPLVAQNLGSIIALGSVMMVALHWSFAQVFDGDFGQAAYWSGYACQAVVSWSAISQLISRGNTRGHSIGIW